jgi:methyltransferase (TIGR00027 family)
MRPAHHPAAAPSEGLAALTRGPLFALACSLLAPSFVFGVPVGAVSWSADMVGMLRAIGSQNPDPRLRNPDHLAQRLCPRPFELRDYAAARRTFDADPEAWAGYFYVNARTRHVDASLQRALHDGATQVVILGAGFDSRAWRFHAGHPTVRFFEVDLPAMIAAKKRRLAQGFIALHDGVVLAAIDFSRQTLAALLPLGYNPAQKTLFILEGVTMYIAEAACAATFDFVRRHAAPGSRIVYDYLLRDALGEGRSAFYGMDYAAQALTSHHEPLVTGWSEPQAAAFAMAHGLVVDADLDSDTLAERYLVGSDGRLDGRWLEGHRIVEASVGKPTRRRGRGRA